MENYKVKIFTKAKEDLREIIDHINTLSPDAALRRYDEVTEKIASLSQFPERCPRPRNLMLAAKGYRYLMVSQYLVFFVIQHKEVQVRRIKGNHREKCGDKTSKNNDAAELERAVSGGGWRGVVVRGDRLVDSSERHSVCCLFFEGGAAESGRR